MKPPDYSEIKAKAELVRRRSIVPGATRIGIVVGAAAVVLCSYIFWPTDPRAQMPCSAVLPAIVFGAAIVGTLFRGAAILIEQIRRALAARKGKLPPIENTPPASNSHAAITDITDR